MATAAAAVTAAQQGAERQQAPPPQPGDQEDCSEADPLITCSTSSHVSSLTAAEHAAGAEVRAGQSCHPHHHTSEAAAQIMHPTADMIAEAMAAAMAEVGPFVEQDAERGRCEGQGAARAADDDVSSAHATEGAGVAAEIAEPLDEMNVLDPASAYIDGLRIAAELSVSQRHSGPSLTGPLRAQPPRVSVSTAGDAVVTPGTLTAARTERAKEPHPPQYLAPPPSPPLLPERSKPKSSLAESILARASMEPP